MRMRRFFVVFGWLAIAGCTSSTTAVHPSPSPSIDRSPSSDAQAITGGCGQTQIYKGGEPDWLTRAGDNNNPKGLPYFITSPAIAAGFVFGYPLRSGAPTNPDNKILWVVDRPRDGNSLVISGHPLSAADPTMQASFPDNSGPGAIYPSEVNVPAAGCWQFEIAWGPNRATVDLVYT